MLKKIGQVAYKLALPATARIHDFFHVSSLKLYKGSILDQPLPLPPEVINYHPVLETYKVLQHRMLPKQEVTVHQILVWWKGLPSTAATWEDLDEFKCVYPNYNLEDKVEVDGGEY